MASESSAESEDKVRDLLEKALADASKLRGVVICGIAHDDGFMVGYANASPMEMGVVGAYFMSQAEAASEKAGEEDAGQTGH